MRPGFEPADVREGLVVKALASHQCSPDSNPGVDAICELRLFLVLSLALKGLIPDTLNSL